ncbi:hypothetical protein NDU88_005935 [Pleurodeles waltl]|uniref:Uncharacterized protein n=1 Tax=Pleurodeles waltl TaxID=8319 RepID=A0AAV7RMI8_PLEWA|nr:hypothetical protein NDU88_005935 [Pleurodeles waltl]
MYIHLEAEAWGGREKRAEKNAEEEGGDIASGENNRRNPEYSVSGENVRRSPEDAMSAGKDVGGVLKDATREEYDSPR